MLRGKQQVFQNSKRGLNLAGFLYLLLFISYIPLLFLGFGSDSDTFTVIDVWKIFLVTDDYVPSRLPGYVIHEFITYLAARVGGSFLSNLVTLCFAVLLVYFMLRLLYQVEIPRSAILVVLLNPVFILNATSTVDYIWALSCFVMGLYLFTKDRVLSACIVIGLASAIRLTISPIVAWIVLYFLVMSIKKDRRSLQLFLPGIALLLAINFAAYYLPLDFTEWNLKRFLHVDLGDASLWSPVLRIGRWGYKNLVFWGIPVVFLFLAAILLSLKNWRKLERHKERNLVHISLGIILITETIFFLFPIEVEYLLPVLPFVAILGGMLLKSKPWLLVALSVLMFINGFYGISLAHPDKPNAASSAVLAIDPEPGYLLKGIFERIPFARCTSNQCYADVLASLSQDKIK